MPKISPLRRNFCGRNMPYTGIFREDLNFVSLRVVLSNAKSKISRLLQLEMCPTRAHFEGKSKLWKHSEKLHVVWRIKHCGHSDWMRPQRVVSYCDFTAKIDLRWSDRKPWFHSKTIRSEVKIFKIGGVNSPLRHSISKFLIFEYLEKFESWAKLAKLSTIVAPILLQFINISKILNFRIQELNFARGEI